MRRYKGFQPFHAPRNRVVRKGTWVRIPPSPPSKGYKKDVAPETPDCIGGFAVSTAEKTESDFVDVKKILFPF